MPKKLLSFLVVMGLISACPLFSSADVVLLKNGEIVEGDIIKKTEEEVNIKSDAGIFTFSSKEANGIITEKMVPPVILPEDIYKERLSGIGENDAQAHYKLGLFCIENGLFDETSTELNKALSLNPKDRDTVIKKLRHAEELRMKELCNIAIFYYNFGEPQKALEYLEGLKAEYSESETAGELDRTISLIKETQNHLVPGLFLSNEDIQTKFKEDKLPLPLTSGNLEKISSFINSMPQEERAAYCRKYFDIGIEYQDRAESYSGNSKAQKKALLTAAYCYKIAVQDKSLTPQASEKYEYVSQKLDQYESIEMRRGLPVPAPGKKDDIKSMLRALGAVSKTYGSRYIYLGKEFENRAAKETSPETQKEYLKIALDCYDIALDYAKDQSSKGIIIVRRQQILKKLNEEIPH